MYKNVTSVTLKGSSSCLFNNLDILPQNSSSGTTSPVHTSSYVSIHKYAANIVRTNNAKNSHRQVLAKESSSAHGPISLTQAKWCSLSSQIVLVITHGKGVQIFDELGNLLLFFHNTLEQGAGSEGKTSFCRGIASWNDYVFVGSCLGQILVFESDGGSSFSLFQTLNAHPTPITAITALKITKGDAEVELACADDAGSISVWKMGGSSKLKYVGNVAENSYPCTSLCLLPNGLLVAGFYTGHIRVFDAASCDKLAEISAHAAAITCMDSTPSLGQDDSCLVISGSEDTFVRLWRISKVERLEIRQEWFTSIQDLMITGIRFHDSGSSFGVTGYDSSEIVLFVRTS